MDTAKFKSCKVISIRKLEKQEFTCDIEVGGKNGSHSYQLENGLVSHNTISLLGGATPGVHYPISKIYIRRLRFDINSPLLPLIRNVGFKIEPCIGSESTTVVVEIPIKLKENIKTSSEISIENKFKDVVLFQKYWSDNQVSVTIDFNVETEGDLIAPLLAKYDKYIKSISFLPVYTNNKLPYPQMPYEDITEEQYNEMIKHLDLSKLYDVVDSMSKEHEIENDVFCDGDKCYRS